MSRFNCTIWIPLTRAQYEDNILIRKRVDELLSEKWFTWRRHEKIDKKLGVRVILISD